MFDWLKVLGDFFTAVTGDSLDRPLSNDEINSDLIFDTMKILDDIEDFLLK